MDKQCCYLCGEIKGLFVYTWKGNVCLSCLSAQTKSSQQSDAKPPKIRKMVGMNMEIKPQL
jgi:hypothetical protein